MNAQPELHVPVMLAEIVALLAPALEAPLTEPSGGRDCILVDCTLGLGGHAHALLTACPQAQLIGLDRDPQALALAARRLAEFADRITLVEAVFDELPKVLARLGRPKVQGVLLDLACPHFRSMIPDADSRTRKMRHWTCGWDARN
jgi:16S rRNA (cytosine1402-N4)-methyltransferase